MSTLFGIYNRNGKPVSSKIFDVIHNTLSYWKPDASGRWLRGAVALGHEMLWNTPESKGEHLPLEQGHFVITMDARLDNRKELAEQLGITNQPLEQVTESEFILAAFCKWGEKCPQYLIGDFAFAIWDKLKQQIFCVRDHLGVKPFYFHLTDSLFVFGNDLKGIVAHPEISKTLNDEAVANYLTNTLLIDKVHTFFNDIKKLPAAHSMTISKESVHKRCYWRPEKAPAVKLPGIEDYAFKLRELLEQAVHDRMRTSYPMTSHLSGGLDSSVIAVIAARKLQEKGQKLLAYNWLHEPFENDDPANFEWANSVTIAQLENIEHSYVSLNSDDIVGYMGEHNIAYGDSACFWYEYPVREAMQKKDSRTILSGWGGDQLSTYHGQSYLANMIREGNMLEVFKGVGSGTGDKKGNMKTALRTFYHTVLMSFVPRQYYHKMPKSLHYKFAPFQFAKQTFSPVLDTELAKLSTLSPQPHPTIKMNMLDSMQRGNLQARMESWAASAFLNRLEYSYPLLDKRIVEFVLGVPAKHFVNNGVGRYLFRKAVDGIIPSNLLWIDKKSERNRVARLLDISMAAYKNIIESFQRVHVDSSYVDFEKLKDTMENIDEDKELVPLAQVVGPALSVIRCENIKN